ncbi:MAG: sigma 54-interacting transcriptional regulator [Gemmatimonadaceae bacterium]
MKGALAELERLARNPTVPILIEGETGTGKTMVARHLHEISPRAAGPFAHVMLAGLDDSLANSDLFGHVPGAFTGALGLRKGIFASAQHGTIFFDEIGKASRAVQQKLLTAIEQREIRPVGSDCIMHVDTRVIAASNVPLADAVAAGEFLPDLYARIRTFRVTIPPLRKRRADIPLLVERFVAEHIREDGAADVPTVSAELMHAFVTADWPHNVRELSATIQWLLIAADGAAELTLDHCRGPLSWLVAGEEPGPLTAEQAERALAEANGNVSQAARILGKDRSTLYRALHRPTGD